ncbi:hypothetical protein CA2015_0256 [Cyclobacterium amurskyense]|uniref:Uncharacterized protein n=1 Tax=Cyclobacterium amurskyense TaxID=320787 RepID=A0A0H4PN96_9BACT|nr:hypothetical protein CA2015_0256 [Cyclobacterium amurskyense]
MLTQTIPFLSFEIPGGRNKYQNYVLINDKARKQPNLSKIFLFSPIASSLI